MTCVLQLQGSLIHIDIIGKSIWVDMEGGGVKNGQKLATSFMDGPLEIIHKHHFLQGEGGREEKGSITYGSSLTFDRPYGT